MASLEMTMVNAITAKLAADNVTKTYTIKEGLGSITSKNKLPLIEVGALSYSEEPVISEGHMTARLSCLVLCHVHNIGDVDKAQDDLCEVTNNVRQALSATPWNLGLTNGIYASIQFMATSYNPEATTLPVRTSRTEVGLRLLIDYNRD